VKQEPMTDDDTSRHQRQQQSFQPRGGHRRNPREQDDKSYQWGKQIEKEKEAPVEKEKPNFGLSGALLKDTNTYKGVVIKYSEPTEARKPKRRWRLYVFKGEQVNENLNLLINLLNFLLIGITYVSNSSSICIFNWS
jgi:smad nuclear-interacting protein 1